MPTENRSSNTEMVSVPREPTREMLAAAREVDGIFPTWRAMVAAAPAYQPHGEPVALPERQDLPHREEFESADHYAAALGETKSWNACLDEIAKLGPLFSRPVQGEPVACAHEWTDDGEFNLTCSKCGKQENHEPYGWVQTRGPAINQFTQEWDVVQDWEDRGIEYKAMHEHPIHADPAEVVARLKELVGQESCDERIALRNEVERWKASAEHFTGVSIKAVEEVNTLRAQLAKANADKEAYGQNAIDLRGEVERLLELISEHKTAYSELEAQLAEDFKQIDDLRAQLADLRGMLRMAWGSDDISAEDCRRIDAALSASAEPSKIGNPELSASTAPAASIPEGYCLMPRRLTAENGAKALLLGEFKLQVTRECPECHDLEAPVEGCEICDGEGEYAQRHTIPWDQIKFIYSEAVKGLATQPDAVLELRSVGATDGQA